MEKQYFELSSQKPEFRTVDEIRNFLKWSVSNGFKYRSRGMRLGVSKLQVKRGIIYHSPFYNRAPNFWIVYATKANIRFYIVREQGNAGKRLQYAFKKYTTACSFPHRDYTVKTVEEIFG